MIGIKNHHQLSLSERQRIVHVAGLGVLVADAGLVDGAHARAQRLQRGAPRARAFRLHRILVVALLVGAAVVEQPDIQFVLGIIHGPGGGDGRRENIFVLVVGRDEDVDDRQLFVGAARQQVLQPLDLIPRLEIDAEISLSDLTMKFVKELVLLEPYGVGNPKPVFAVRGLSLKTKPKILTANTLKLWVTDGKLTYEAVGFKKAFNFKLDPAPRNFSLAFTPSVNTWQGHENIQLVIKDLQI